MREKTTDKWIYSRSDWRLSKIFAEQENFLQHSDRVIDWMRCGTWEVGVLQIEPRDREELQFPFEFEVTVMGPVPALRADDDPLLIWSAGVTDFPSLLQFLAFVRTAEAVLLPDSEQEHRWGTA